MSWLTQYNLFLILAKSGCICTAAGHTSWPSTWSKADLWMSSPNCLSKPSSIELAAHIPQITLTLLSEERLTTHSRQVCCSLHQAPPPPPDTLVHLYLLLLSIETSPYHAVTMQKVINPTAGPISALLPWQSKLRSCGSSLHWSPAKCFYKVIEVHRW